jgi:flagellar assembly factor FliW
VGRRRKPPERQVTTTHSTDEDLAEKILFFPDGLPGFPELHRFLLVDFHEDGIFQQLQSVDDSGVSMIVTVPWLFMPDYAPVLGDVEQAELELERAEDAIVFVPVSFDPDEKQVFLNLLGPFVVNGSTRRGLQVVLAGSEYSPRTPIEIDVD